MRRTDKQKVTTNLIITFSQFFETCLINTIERKLLLLVPGDFNQLRDMVHDVYDINRCSYTYIKKYDQPRGLVVTVSDYRS
jgi:hypothetical protein